MLCRQSIFSEVMNKNHKRNKRIKLCDGKDYVTQDMYIGILSGEEEHRQEFAGFLKEYEK